MRLKPLLILGLLVSPVAAHAQPECGSPPLVEDQTLKGDLEGKARLLSGAVDDPNLKGRVEAARTDVFSKYPNAGEAHSDAYLEYVFCRFVLSDPKLTAQERAQAILAFQQGEKMPAKTPPDRTGLRLETERVAQAVPLVGNAQPSIAGEPVFCETVKLTLIIGHNHGGKWPILVDAIGLHVEPFPSTESHAPTCEIDPLQTKPFGIVLRDTYLFNAKGTSVAGRYITSAQPGAARPVSADNILTVGSRKQSVSLEPDEVPLAWDVYVTLDRPGTYRVWFSADYDAGGPKIAETKKIILSK